MTPKYYYPLVPGTMLRGKHGQHIKINALAFLLVEMVAMVKG
jgi:hypothetical protein